VAILVTVEKDILELKHQSDLNTWNIRYKNESTAGMSPFNSESISGLFSHFALPCVM